MNEIAVPSEWRDLVCVVESVTDEDRKLLLTSEELERVSAFRFERRRQEWAAARIAARLLAVRLGIVERPQDLVIGVRDSCPVAAAGTDEWALSLSHSGQTGAAALGRGRIGVDLERSRQVDPASVRFFLTDGEIDTFRSSADLQDSIVHFWSAKEAAFKAAPGARLLRQVRFEDIRTGRDWLTASWDDGEAAGTVRTGTLGQGFVVALARA